MGCFLGCFGASKNRRRQRRREHVQPRGNRISEGPTKGDYLNATVPTVEEVPNVIPITDVSEKVEEKCNQSPGRKRVTFDSIVKTYEHILPEESVELPKEEKEEDKPQDKSVKSCQTQSSSENSSISSKTSGSFPSNHRYQNCRESDDEEEDGIDSEGSDLDDDEDEDGLLDEDYYSDSDDYYETKLLNQAKDVYTEEIADNGLDIGEIEAKPRGSNASARDRSGYVHPVLNPVENLSQWKAVKSKRRATPIQNQKENLNLVSDIEDKRDSFSIEPGFDQSSFSFKPKPKDEPKKTKNQEFAVDTSLSTWLSASETTISACNSVSMGFAATTPEKNTSFNSRSPIKNHDDRPILGALTVEEIKQFSATSSPRKSPSRSPHDDTPIIGSVGGYWNHSDAVKDSGSASSFKGIPNTTSKYREDKRVNWRSTPFEARLERALNRGGH
ncbi:PREDICTED: eisosome protein SEG2 [Tarenaya hassleriana]|uniref:eisosome protein SEG2 n=1 Tax=Tarenaya hassleriana TaxID=28532 RepID=UPI00053C8436|nr:PREDICTED: eisosome protein SEG2 [Tarenaya hassleriana]